MVGYTHLAFDITALIVAVGRSTKRGTWLVSPSNTTTLCKILLALCPANLHLLLLTTAAELVWLEGALGLERSAAMLGNVLVGHGCGGTGASRRCGEGEEEEGEQCLYAEGIYGVGHE